MKKKVGKSKKLNVMIVGSEVFPFAKTGGLADVLGSLPLYLEKNGLDVSVMLPLYKEVKKGKFKLENTKVSFDIKVGNAVEKAEIYKGKIGKNIRVYFVKNDNFYDRDFLYVDKEGNDYEDNLERFSFFNRAVLEFIKLSGENPNVIHCNDWQTGLLPVYLKTTYKELGKKIATVFTIHNLSYQGIFKYSKFSKTGLPKEVFNINGIEFYGDINLLKAGLMYADILNTVSEKYALEIQTQEYGCGLNGVLSYRRDDLYGILNGVDYNVWSPEKDNLIPKKYSLKNISGKKVCKKKLLEVCKLKTGSSLPLIGMITRIAEQKGIDILIEAMEVLMKLDIGFILLGTGEKYYENKLKSIAGENKDKFYVKFAYDNKLAHLIEAGSDMFLMPSKFEPCGLNQIYSLKYGTIPIVRATGGLDDTIENYSRKTKKGNGFKFSAFSPVSLIAKVLEAVNLYEEKDHWKKIIQNAMKADFSWNVSAVKYEKLYKKAIEKIKKV